MKVEERSTAQGNSFTPHLTVNARTREQGKIAFQRSPSANVNTTLLLNALTVSVLPRLEIGTAPLYFLVPTHRGNVVGRLNFWRADDIDWLLGWAFARFADSYSTGRVSEQAVEIQSTDYSLDLRSVQLATNLHPLWTRFSFSLMYAVVSTNYESRGSDNISIYQTVHEYGVDASYPILDRMDLTLGAGIQRPLGFSAYEKTTFGCGLTTAWYRPNRFFSKPSLGVHQIPEFNQTQLLLSTTIL